MELQSATPRLQSRFVQPVCVTMKSHRSELKEWFVFAIGLAMLLVMLLLVVEGPANPRQAVPEEAAPAPAPPVRVEMDLAQLSAPVSSSDWDPHHSVDRVLFGRVYREGAHSWCAASNDLNQHVTFWFPRLAHVVGVSTAGRPGEHAQWVTQYQVLVTTDGVTWRAVDNNRVFNGNTDQTTIVRHNFEAPVEALGLRIAIRAVHGHISMRAAVHGWLL